MSTHSDDDSDAQASSCPICLTSFYKPLPVFKSNTKSETPSKPVPSSVTGAAAPVSSQTATQDEPPIKKAKIEEQHDQIQEHIAAEKRRMAQQEEEQEKQRIRQQRKEYQEEEKQETTPIALVEPCLHAFCVDCIAEWTRMSSKCPLCKEQFNSVLYNFSVQEQADDAEVDVDVDYTRMDLVDLKDYAQRRAQHRVRKQQLEYRQHNVIHERRKYIYAHKLYVTPLKYNDAKKSSTADGEKEAKKSNTSNSAVYIVVLDTALNLLYEKPKSTPKTRSTAEGPEPPPAKATTTKIQTDTHAKRVWTKAQQFIHTDLRAIVDLSALDVVEGVVVGLLKHTHNIRKNNKAIRELTEFLGTHAHHFLHELACFLASPYNMYTYNKMCVYKDEKNTQRNNVIIMKAELMQAVLKHYEIEKEADQKRKTMAEDDMYGFGADDYGTTDFMDFL